MEGSNRSHYQQDFPHIRAPKFRRQYRIGSNTAAARRQAETLLERPVFGVDGNSYTGEYGGWSACGNTAPACNNSYHLICYVNP
jgi:hypothetical protein